MNRKKLSLLPVLLALILILSACTSGQGTKLTTAYTFVHPCDVGHTDTDRDGFCDICLVPVTVTVDFYVVNDLHGKFADTDSQPGVDELSTYLKESAAKDDYALFLSAGDMWQGSAESNLTSGAIVTDWMNEMGFVAMTLGNHEYDWGEEAVEANADRADFPFLAINVYDRETDTRVDYAEASVLIDLGALQIGIIGAMGDCYSSIATDKVEDIYFKTGAQLTALVKEESERLQDAGADFIVYTLHDGHGSSGANFLTDSKLASYYDPSLSDGYVDLVFEGHSHQRYIATDSHGIYHLQGGGENKGITHVEVDVNLADLDTHVSTAEFVSADVYQNMDDHPIVDTLLGRWDSVIAEANRVVGVNPTYRNSDSIKQLVADLYYQAGVERWGKDYDIALGGGFISVRSPYNLNRGEVTYGALQMLLPFDNRLVLCSIRGSDLKRRFIDTSNSSYFICCNRSITDNIDPNSIYYIVTDTYCSGYAPNRLTVVAEYDEGVYARDLVANWLASLQ